MANPALVGSTPTRFRQIWNPEPWTDLRAASQNPAREVVTAQRELRTGAWHGDLPVHLEFPARWKVTTHWPRTPPPLSDQQIEECLNHPIGQPPLRELLKGKTRPVILVDDVNRPTPAGRIFPALLQQFHAAGVPLPNITIIMARGSHGEPQRDSMLSKVGEQAAASCRLLLHDPYRDTVKVGKTSFGTPVHVNRHVREADFVMGVGGVYPNNSAGFGGGAKLALGVLHIRVISQLHGKHSGAGWGNVVPGNTFRQDLEEIAQTIRLQSMVIAQVDAGRELVRLRFGDYHRFYDEEVVFAREAFTAPAPANADVVISNAFPNDLSLTFVTMKGIYPLNRAASEASRVVLAACSEGAGFHGVYPVVHKSRYQEQLHRLRRISLLSPGEIAEKAMGRMGRAFRRTGRAVHGTKARVHSGPIQHKNPIWLYRTGTHSDILPSPVKGIRSLSDWSQILNIIRQEQNGRDDLKVAVYPCTPLQVLE